MVQVLAFLFVVLLLCVGWQHPFKEVYAQIRGEKTEAVAQLPPPPGVPRGNAAVQAQPTAKPSSGQWMWKPTGMDAPYANKRMGGR